MNQQSNLSQLSESHGPFQAQSLIQVNEPLIHNGLTDFISNPSRILSNQISSTQDQKIIKDDIQEIRNPISSKTIDDLYGNQNSDNYRNQNDMIKYPSFNNSQILANGQRIIDPQFAALNNFQFGKPNLSSVSSLNTFSMLTKKTICRHKFSPEEDEKLRQIVQEQGSNNWRFVAELMPGRSARQCRDRWKNYLAPGIKNGPWTPEEDQLLEEKYRELGSQWSRIAKCFPNRTDINIKNRWATRGGRVNRAQSMAFLETFPESRPRENNNEQTENLGLGQSVRNHDENIILDVEKDNGPEILQQEIP